jgi:hypothetical protein
MSWTQAPLPELYVPRRAAKPDRTSFAVFAALMFALLGVPFLARLLAEFPAL